ncbi:hypothetical protein F511_23951 [Dorcoceras hygrometricum]|uniref:Uncharacterized protein n=1 Tax=Dorcoceras hygrometricum TaxID=472368 RepID=A0A2Z7BQN3_9LAMI|nr:hypothetical protein F511_23951 [Dorcoceras hygrometricum]
MSLFNLQDVCIVIGSLATLDLPMVVDMIGIYVLKGPHCITDSACKNQLVVVSVQYGPFNPYIPIKSTTIGKSRVAKDPIAMHTSWRSNSDIGSVTSIGYPRMSASGESSTTMHRLLHASGSHPIPPPDDPKQSANTHPHKQHLYGLLATHYCNRRLCCNTITYADTLRKPNDLAIRIATHSNSLQTQLWI